MSFANFTTLIVIAFLNGAGIASALFGAIEWPGPRSPTLIERWQAEVIVFADVISTEYKDGGQSSQLKVISIIKSGDRKIPDEIKIFVPLGSHWPYTFTANRKAIAFLRFDEKREQYTDFNGRDGGLDVDEATGLFFVRQYAKLPAILKEQDPKKLLELEVEWNVEFALPSKTRFEAAHGIEILWNIWNTPQKRNLLANDKSTSAADLLTAGQKTRICLLFANEAPDIDSYHLIRLLQRHPSPEIDCYLLKSLKLSLTNEGSIPIDSVAISDLAFELLPPRGGFELSKSLESAYDDYQDRQSDYAYNISIGEEYSEAERRDARTALIMQWRTITTEFLKIPELQKIQCL